MLRFPITSTVCPIHKNTISRFHHSRSRRMMLHSFLLHCSLNHVYSVAMTGSVMILPLREMGHSIGKLGLLRAISPPLMGFCLYRDRKTQKGFTFSKIIQIFYSDGFQAQMTWIKTVSSAMGSRIVLPSCASGKMPDCRSPFFSFHRAVQAPEVLRFSFSHSRYHVMFIMALYHICQNYAIK